MANRSEDEWSLVSEEEDVLSSLVSEEEEVLSDLSFDEAEPEPEVEVESDPTETTTTTTEIETADVLSLLTDTSCTKRSTAGYSREIRVSLLSPAHQEELVGAPPQLSTPAFNELPKRTVKLAFIESGVRPKSFPERLRAITAAMRPVLEEVVPSLTFTEVTPFKQDQSTQVNFDATATELHEARATLLRAALDRSMALATQLRAKSKDHERLSFRIAELESIAVQTEQKTQRYAMKCKMNERSLSLAKQQAKLTAEYQDNLKTIAESLRRDNFQLASQNAALRGEDESLATRSLDELEEIETILARGMDNVRAALRAKYRAAVEKHRKKEMCLVCFAKPISVVLLPCRHQVLCASCALRVTTCPVDRNDIQDKVLTYRLNAFTDCDN